VVVVGERARVAGRGALGERHRGAVGADGGGRVGDVQHEGGRAAAAVGVGGGDGDGVVAVGQGSRLRPGPRPGRVVLRHRASVRDAVPLSVVVVGERAGVGGRGALGEGDRGAVGGDDGGRVGDVEHEGGAAGRAVGVGGGDGDGVV